jgi:hypothetical protein
MYPSAELRILAERREYLQARIAVRREDCAAAGENVRLGVERVVAWAHLARAGGLLGSIGASLLGFGVHRPAGGESDPEGGRKASFIQKAAQWAPVALRAVRLISSFV